MHIALIKPPTTGLLSENLSDIVGREHATLFGLEGLRIKRVPERTRFLPMGLLILASALDRALPGVTFSFIDLALRGQAVEKETVSYGPERLTLTWIGGTLEERAFAEPPDYCFLTGDVATERRALFSTAHCLKQLYPLTKVVVGGARCQHQSCALCSPPFD